MTITSTHWEKILVEEKDVEWLGITHYFRMYISDQSVMNLSKTAEHYDYAWFCYFGEHSIRGAFDAETDEEAMKKCEAVFVDLLKEWEEKEEADEKDYKSIA